MTSGLYRFVRHPLYLGEMVAVWGYVVAWPAPWAIAAALLFTALQSWRARVEEGRLLAHHPATPRIANRPASCGRASRRQWRRPRSARRPSLRRAHVGRSI